MIARVFENYGRNSLIKRLKASTNASGAVQRMYRLKYTMYENSKT